jgi:hypothetical protein
VSFLPFSLEALGLGEIERGKKWRKKANDIRMPPVDAIYRPHVVHHTIVPPELKATQLKNKTKRYFSADD